jgi:2-oxoglutarate ferredoxin oxidoreductase subunit delta
MTSEAPARARRRVLVEVDGLVCDGCGICVFFCKPAVFEISRELSIRGVYPALAVRPDACTCCGLCELGCPQLAICVVPEEREP